MKSNKRENNEQLNERKSNKSPAEQKPAGSVENISAMKRLLKIKTYKMTFRHISRHFVSGSFENVAWDVHASRE